MSSKSKKAVYKELYPESGYKVEIIDIDAIRNGYITNTTTKRTEQKYSPTSFRSGHNKADKALRYTHNMTTYGDHVSNLQLYFDRLYSVYPEIELDNLYQYVFIVRPDMNIYKSGGKELVSVSSTKKYLPNSSPANDQFFKYMHNTYPNILKSLTHELDGTHDFIPYLVGRTESLQIPDYGIKQYKLNQPFSGFNLPYAGHALDSMSGGSFDLTFKDDNELRIRKMFQAWLTYISNVTRNIFGPKDKYICDNIIDYATSVYCITCKPDAETIVHWTKYTGAFPTVVPNSDLSFNRGGNVKNDITVSFDYFLQEAMDPYILVDFNKNAHVTDAGKQGYIPIYNKKTMEYGGFKDYRSNTMKEIDKHLVNATVKVSDSVPMILGTGSGIVGCPFIAKDSHGIYHLKWKSLDSSTIDKMAGK